MEFKIIKNETRYEPKTATVTANPFLLEEPDIIRCNYDLQDERSLFYQKMLCVLAEEQEVVKRQQIVAGLV